ncbi:MAG: tellurite resistance TerB family protein [Planctomycetota bacterium]|jgi:hypothetical protein
MLIPKLPEMDLLDSAAQREHAHRWACHRPVRVLVFFLTLFVAVPVAGEVFFRSTEKPPSWLVEARQWVLNFNDPIGLGVMTVVLAGVLIGLFRRYVRRKLRKLLTGMGVPVCMSCGQDLRGNLHSRCPKCGEEFDISILAPAEGKAREQAAADQIRSEAEQSIPLSGQPSIFEVLLDALCCIMVSDRKVCKSERKRIHLMLRQAKCPWTPALIDQRINRFAACVKKGQYTSLLDETCEKVHVFKEQDKEQVLTRGLEAVAQADGAEDASEHRVFERFRVALQ